MQRDGKDIDRVQSGDFFGEVAFIATFCSLLKDLRSSGHPCPHLEVLGLVDEKTDMRRTASVTAHTMCRCLILNVKDFLVAFQSDPKGLAAALW